MYISTTPLSRMTSQLPKITLLKSNYICVLFLIIKGSNEEASLSFLRGSDSNLILIVTSNNTMYWILLISEFHCPPSIISLHSFQYKMGNNAFIRESDIFVDRTIDRINLVLFYFVLDSTMDEDITLFLTVFNYQHRIDLNRSRFTILQFGVVTFLYNIFL